MRSENIISNKILIVTFLTTLLFLIGITTQVVAEESPCIACHKTITPKIVDAFQSGAMGTPGIQNPTASKMAGGLSQISCENCHGLEHNSAADFTKAKMPTPDTCDACHAPKVVEFNEGKHALAWIAMNAMPGTTHQAKPIIGGQKGCGGCHKMGSKNKTGIPEYRYGMGSCDSCHTRHKFSTAEARRPEACLPCHMGFNHPQWEMYSTSKHGVIYAMQGDTWDWNKHLSENPYPAPTCQICHMTNGNHKVITSWGFLAVRLPEPDSEWMSYRTIILKGTGVLDPDGKPTARLDVVKAGKVARLTAEEWQAQREAMLKVCGQCHSANYAKQNLENADAIIKQADALMAEGISTVAELYKDGLLSKPKDYAYAYPDLLTFYEAPSPIEQELYGMFLEHRMRTFQGAFHMNPDYMHWYGWAPMKTSLNFIKDEAKKIREGAAIETRVKQAAAAYPLSIAAIVIGAISAIVVAILVGRKTG